MGLLRMHYPPWKSKTISASPQEHTTTLKTKNLTVIQLGFVAAAFGVGHHTARKSAVGGDRTRHLQVFDGGAIDKPKGGGILRVIRDGFTEGDRMSLTVFIL